MNNNTIMKIVGGAIATLIIAGLSGTMSGIMSNSQYVPVMKEQIKAMKHANSITLEMVANIEKSDRESIRQTEISNKQNAKDHADIMNIVSRQLSQLENQNERISDIAKRSDKNGEALHECQEKLWKYIKE